MSSHIESAAPIEHGMDEVFLTPRVLDHGAFERMSATLKELVKEAAGHGKVLQQSVGDVRGLSAGIRQALTELQSRIERAGKVGPQLQEWIAQAEELSRASIDERRVVEHLRGTLDKVVEGKRAEFEHAVAPTVELLRQIRKDVERARAAAESAGDAERIAEKIESESGTAARAAIERLTQQLDVVLEDRLLRCQETTERLERAAEALTTRAMEIERASAARFASAEDRLVAIERRLAATIERSERVDSDVSGRMTRTIEAAEIRARQVADEVAALSRSGIAEIEASLDRVASKATSLASLPVTLERAEQLLVDVERSKSDVQALAQQIQIARETLSREIISASEQIDVIGSKAATVTTRKGRAGSGDTSVAETIARQRELQGVLLTTMRSAESAEQLGRLRLAELREVEGMLTRVQHASRALRIQVMDLEGRVRGAGEQFGEAA